MWSACNSYHSFLIRKLTILYSNSSEEEKLCCIYVFQNMGTSMYNEWESRGGICKMYGRFSFILLLTRRIPAAMNDTWQARKLSTGFHCPSKIPIFQVDFILCGIYSLLCISCNADATLFWALVILKDQEGITVRMKCQADLIFYLVKAALFNLPHISKWKT